MSWYEDFLERLQDLNTALGGDPVVLSNPSSFEADSLILLLAAANAAAGGGGGGGTAVSWARCKGTTPIEILASGGPNAPTAISRSGVGIYAITRPAAASADYPWWGFGAGRVGVNDQGYSVAKDLNIAQTTTQFHIRTLSFGGSSQDQEEFTVFLL